MADKRTTNKKRTTIKYTSARETAEKAGVFTNTAIRLPEGFTFYKIDKAGTYRFSIMPFVVGKGNPNASEGEVHFERTYHINRNIGPDPKKTYCSLAQNWNERDPVVELSQQLQRNPNVDEEFLKSLKTSMRQLFIVRDEKDHDKGFQILDQSFHCFGKKLMAKLRADEDGEYENFFHLQGGCVVKATFEQEKFGNITFLLCTDVEFKKREEDFDDDVLEQMPCLDDCLIRPSYKQMKAILEATGGADDVTEEEEDEDEDEEDVKPKNVKVKDEEEDEEEDDTEDDEEEEKPKKKAVKKTAFNKDDEDEEENDEEDDDKETEDDEEEDDKEDDEDEEESKVLKVGTKVTFKAGKKLMTGIVKKINTKNEIYEIDAGKSTPNVVDFDDASLQVVEDDEEDDKEDDEEEDEEEEEKPKKKSKKPAKDEDDEDDDMGFD